MVRQMLSLLRENGITAGRVGIRLKALAKPELIGWLLVVGAVTLRLREYAAYLSLGNDEAALARNIADRSFSGLTQPLDFHQAAPILFLFIQKIFVLAFGNRDLVLEIFPLVSGLLAVYLFHRIAREHFGTAGLLATFAFAISGSLVLYSANPKQYSSDAMLTLLLVYLAMRCIDDRSRAREFLVLGFVGAVAIWVSHPSALVLAGIGAAIGIEKLSRRDFKKLAWCMALGAAWAASLGIDYLVSLRHMTMDPYLTKYWQGAFMPLPPWSNPRWFLDTYMALVSVSFSTAAAFSAVLCFGLILAGGVSLWVRKRTLALVIILPFVMSLAASGLQKYPLQYRFLVFLVPLIYLLLAEGLWRIYLVLPGRNRTLALASTALLFLIVLSPAIIAAKRNFFKPARLWDMRAAVEYIGNNWKPGDAVLVSGGGETFAYYASSQGLKTGYTLIDTSHRIIRYRLFMEDLEVLAGRGACAWIVFAHFEKNGDYARYDSYIGKHASVQDMFQTGYARVDLCSIER